MNKWKISAILTVLLATVPGWHGGWGAGEPSKPVESYAAKKQFFKPLPPEEALRSIEIPQGCKLQLIASEPMVQEPASFAFDADGALYVCEWLTYMQDEEGTGQLEPASRIVKLVDENGDGTMDKRTIFVDKILLPRTILPLHDRVLVNLTGDSSIWSYFDDNKDGVADRRELAFKGQPNNDNIEHQNSGLVWNLDNYIYGNYSRWKWKQGNLLEEPYKNGRMSQWGLARDDQGRIYGSWAGAVSPVNSFHIPGAYPVIDFDRKIFWAAGYGTPNAICRVEDQSSGGYDRQNDRVLKEFSATCGQTVFRSDLFPAYSGMVASCEPVGRLIRLTRIEWEGGIGRLHNSVPGGEFIRSADPFFRPVWSDIAPDGGFVFADMYRGIIQEKQWFPTKGGHEWVKRYHRVKEWGMVGVNRHGRIYRLLPMNKKPRAVPSMSSYDARALVMALADPNGWRRDTAQKLIVGRQEKLAVPLLKKLLATERAPLYARLCALWSLEGLSALTPKMVLDLQEDASTILRCSALQAGELWLKDQNSEIYQALPGLLSGDDPGFATQAYLSLVKCGFAQDDPLIVDIGRRFGDHPILRALLDRDAKERKQASVSVASESAKLGQSVYNGFCANCHGRNGEGVAISGNLIAPRLQSSRLFAGDNSELVVGGALLKGLSGPLNGSTYSEGLMISLEKIYDDEQLSAVINFVGESWNGWGEAGKKLTPQQVAVLRLRFKDREMPWTDNEIPHLKTLVAPKK